MYKIGIDATLVRGDRITGIERTIIELLKQFSMFDGNNIVFDVFCHRGGKEMFSNIKMSENFKIHYSPSKNRIFTEQIWLPFAMKNKKIDFAFFTTLGPSLFYDGHFCVHVHDAIPWLYPETLSKGMKYYYKPLLQKALKNNKLDLVTTVSNHSKKDLINLFPNLKDKIEVVYGGISENFLNYNCEECNYEDILSKYSIEGDYIISIATLEPRKNIKSLIGAFQIIKENYPNLNDLKLVLVGRKGWENELEISEEVKKHVILTGFVEDEDLPVILSKAKLFVLPSLYEGLGLPVLEAMACAVPCVVSNTSSLPEVGSDAAIYFDPSNVVDIQEKIIKTLFNDDLRSELTRKGHNQVAAFSWDRTATKIYKLFLELKKRTG